MPNKTKQDNFFIKTSFFIWVALAYFFYLGYFHCFGIPQQMVDVIFDDLLSLRLVASLVIIFLIITMAGMLDGQEPNEREINYIVLFLLMSPGIALSWWVKFSLISVFVFILIPGFLVFSIFSNRKKFRQGEKRSIGYFSSNESFSGFYCFVCIRFFFGVWVWVAKNYISWFPKLYNYKKIRINSYRLNDR